MTAVTVYVPKAVAGKVSSQSLPLKVTPLEVV